MTGSEKIVETRDLPGFTHDGVTYESHHFYIHFCRYERDGRNPSANPSTRRFSSVLVIVNHGGGWEVWSGDYMLAAALHRYGDDNMGAFWLCWYLLDSTKEALHVGRHEASREYRQAFAEGRLKKRKLPRQNSVKIWIEPPATVEAVA
ncbi:MAG: hypothetical protein EA385_15125 [Salinarimonadaceae bacterium]|nr:MAG: hypothetical protein EA385_15125 [Salinarimonadaceae bacterium]